ncbi:MAG: TonB-dependent siderophore receptor, partial [Gammaproteobacteria bacterium]
PVPPAEQPVELDPITVIGQPLDQGFKATMQESATKTPLTIRETPQSISVITRDSIKARQAFTLSQALETAAGVTSSSDPGPFAGRSFTGFTTFDIRGVDTPFYFGQLEDGFFAPQLTGTRDLATYERVEVVKGPSSVLYGRGSAAGFINLVTKKPLPEFAAEISPQIGSFDFYRVDTDVTGPLLNSDKARGRLVLAYENAGSFVDFAESERIVVAPSLEFDITASTRLLLQGTYQDDSFVPHYGVPLQRDGEDFKAPDVRRSLFFGVPDRDEDNSTRELLTGTLQLDQQLGDRWLATLRLNAQSPELRASQDSYAYFLAPNGDTTLYNSIFENEADIWTGELRLNGEVDLFGRPAHLMLGAEHNDFDYHRRDAYVGLGTANIYEENFADIPIVEATAITKRDTRFEGTGVYGQMQFRPLDRLSILLGGRYDWADTKLSTTPPGSDATGSEQEDEEFTWRAGTTFDVTQQIAVYGLYAQSFSPTIFGSTRDGGPLDPETGEIWEAGLKTEWLDGKLGVNAALFRIERDDVPI